jgi:mannosyl-glycoprotein endo-beta-N-acetylglucosaminidase
MRSGPGAGYPVVAVLEHGTEVLLLGRNADSSWVYVRMANLVEGWVSSFYLVTNISSWSSLPVFTATNTATEPTAFVNTGSVNVRHGPSPAYGILMTLGYGHAMSLLGRNEDGGWAQVRVNGQIGWVDATFIGSSIDLQTLPVTSGSVPPPVIIPPVIPPTILPPVPPATGPGTGKSMVTAERLNVRAGAGPSHAVVTTIEWGTWVFLLGRNQDGSWLKIRLENGWEGWVSSLYMVPFTDETFTTLPVVAESEWTATVITGALNVRYGPGPQYASFTTLPYGAIVSPIARNADGSWVKVAFNGLTGWVDPSYLAHGITINALPIATQ